MSADDIVSLYERRAHDWAGDRARQTVFIEKGWLDRFIALVEPGGTVLDLGCGPGKPMAEYLIANGLDVCGVDSSPTMIAMARENLPGREFIVADMRTLRLGRRFSGILAWDSFFHLTPDGQRRMFANFREHAGTSAALMYTSGPRPGEAIGELRGEPLYHASLAPDEYRGLLATHGFAVVAERMEDPDCGGHSVWLAQRREDG
ncbi:MAG TPA: class I SAM-dependent methyltransferase [Rhizomicrobium sp.]|nr:class I SAM-dependent methyltransferase [Rhizomicrobium sp.]